WFAPPDRQNHLDNQNEYYHGINEIAFGNPDVVLTDRIERLISLVYGALAVLGAYGIARESFARERWVLTATAFFAFSPVLIYMGAMLSNDVSATAWATLAIWSAFIVLRRGATPARILVLSLPIGLAGLTKVSTLLIVPGILLAIGLASPTCRLRVRNLALFAIIVGLILGPWIAYGVSTFHDPLGLRTHEGSQLTVAPALLDVLRALPDVYLSYWAKFGSAAVWLSPAVYALLTAVLALSIWGYWRRFRRSRFAMSVLTRHQIYVGITIIVPAAAALLYWLITLLPVAFSVTGRLIYFVHGLIAVAIVGGLCLLASDRPAREAEILRGAPIALLMGVSLVLGPFVVWSLYAPPRLLSSSELPPLQGTPVDYDRAIRFLGFADAVPTIHAGSLYTIRLCWQVLSSTTRDGAFALKLFDSHGYQAGGRTSVPGLGHFNATQWRPGDTFCDRVEMPVDSALSPGKQYNLLLTIQDVQGSQHEWPATAGDGSPLRYNTLLTVTVAP
ncbi:MAG TPA: glycosyltransferase family 39 protein, partial [Aggregatilineales bacterium]|nr:glycosyltransferase family 39 protein [Aggregatilineales bacterium]